mmetsp:Transcript_18222/g.58219  ORF Transcript_18222/g.58219 Transcript_18222/m.58219 type:complete len:150 (-) Transcript_18222:202-651(-)
MAALGVACNTFDFQQPIERQVLCKLIGATALSALEACFRASHGLSSDGEECVRYRLRRTAVHPTVRSGQDAPHINFHRDVTSRTMQVALNPESEYEGGRVIYCTAEGLKAAPREPGTASVHGADVLHGVTALTRGVRFSLFLLGPRRNC